MVGLYFGIQIAKSRIKRMSTKISFLVCRYKFAVSRYR